jgi:hypothetical protein
MTNSRGGHAVGTVHSEGYDAVRTGHIGRAYYDTMGGRHSVYSGGRTLSRHSRYSGE